MPIRWTDQNKLLLFQKVFEQAPNFKIDFQLICDNWPGPDAPTFRGVKDQWSYCKKGTSRNANSTVNSPKTPAKSASQKQTSTSSLKMSTLILGNKRVNSNPNTLGFSTKKRKVKHEADASELSAEAQISDDEGELGDEETDENVADTGSSPTPVTRCQPRRSRTRTKPIVESEYESTSGNDVVKKENSNDEDDSDFDLKKDYESKLNAAERARIKRELKKNTQSGKKMMKEGENRPAALSGMTTDWKGHTSSMFADLSDNAAEEDADVRSEATKRTSWQTAPSQFDDFDQI